MATYAVNVLFGLDMQHQLVLVDAVNIEHAKHLSLKLVEHDGLWDFLSVECVQGTPALERHVEEGLYHFRKTFVGPAEDHPF